MGEVKDIAVSLHGDHRRGQAEFEGADGSVDVDGSRTKTAYTRAICDAKKLGMPSEWIAR